MAGLTVSTNFPLLNPFSGQAAYHGPTTLASDRDGVTGDAFVARLNTVTNQLIFSTYLGGSDDDQANAIAVDPSGIYIAGMTKSSDFPTLGAIQSTLAGRGDMEDVGDAFVASSIPPGRSCSILLTSAAPLPTAPWAAWTTASSAGLSTERMPIS